MSWPGVEGLEGFAGGVIPGVRADAVPAELVPHRAQDRGEHQPHVPFVQGNLLASGTDDPEDVRAWRTQLQQAGVWANDPVPMFPYPGSPDYTRRWGAPDDRAWERAMEHYLAEFSAFSDIQDSRPLPLAELELPQ